MTHILTIDQKRCHGLANCRACERIMPGLVDYCATHGRLMIGEWALREKSATISALATACESRAIMVKPA